MKTLNIVPVLILFIPLSLQAQSGEPRTILSVKKFRSARSSGNDSILATSRYLSDTLIKKRPGRRNYDDFIFRYPEKRFFPAPEFPRRSETYPDPGQPRGAEICPDPDMPREPEIYPGAPKFYGKSRPIPSPFEKSFNIPHRIPQNQKYHLIIKDPLTKRIIN